MTTINGVTSTRQSWQMQARSINSYWNQTVSLNDQWESCILEIYDTDWTTIASDCMGECTLDRGHNSHEK